MHWLRKNLPQQIVRYAKFALANFVLRKICPGKFCVNSRVAHRASRKVCPSTGAAILYNTAVTQFLPGQFFAETLRYTIFAYVWGGLLLLLLLLLQLLVAAVAAFAAVAAPAGFHAQLCHAHSPPPLPPRTVHRYFGRLPRRRHRRGTRRRRRRRQRQRICNAGRQ